MTADAPVVTTSPALPWGWRIASLVATAAAVVLLGVVIADWGWRWLGPKPPPPPAAPLVAENWTAAITAAPLFGRTAAPPSSAAGAPLALQGDIRLLGVFAERGGGGNALFRVAARPLLVQAGNEIVKDVTLVEVRPEGVKIRDRGELRELPLRPDAREAVSPPTVVAARNSPARNIGGAACALPAGYKGPVYRLNAELLTGIAARPENWQTVLAPVAGGGLAVREGSGFATMLGLKSGDRMTQANGIALAGIDDILVAFVKPLVASQSVRVAGTRDGKPAEWLFVNAGACPG